MREGLRSSSKRRMGSRTSSSSAWSDLYPEIIQSISQHLKSRFDVLSFRRVCKRWREHCVPLSPNFLSPLLPYRFPCTLPQYFYEGIGYYDIDCHLDLVVKSIYLITPKIVVENEAASPTSSSLSSWMVMATELEPGKTLLRHPLTGEQIEHLPNAIDLTLFQISELEKGYQLQGSFRRNIDKVVLCSSFASPVSDCTAMILYSSGGLAAVRLSESVSPGWSVPRWRFHSLYDDLDDIVSFKGIHVAVNPDGRLFSLEYEAEDSSPVVVAGILAGKFICNRAGWRKRLVVDPLSDKLYLVERESLLRVRSRRNSRWRVRFRVYEFNEECKRWDKVGALCHYRVLFVGVRHCFFTPAPIKCLANCIVFVADYLDHPLFSIRNANERIGVYHLGNRQYKFSFISDYPVLLQMMEPLPTCFTVYPRHLNTSTFEP